MNGHCSKAIYSNHGKYFCINILFVKGVCMFDGIAYEGRKTELANAFYFLTVAYFFYYFF